MVGSESYVFFLIGSGFANLTVLEHHETVKFPDFESVAKFIFFKRENNVREKILFAIKISYQCRLRYDFCENVDIPLFFVFTDHVI